MVAIKRGAEIEDPINIRDLIVPGVGNRRIFRIFLTNTCRFSCDYCPMRAERDLPRHALEPASLARLFMTAFRRLGRLVGRVSQRHEPRGERAVDEQAAGERWRSVVGLRGSGREAALSVRE